VLDALAVNLDGKPAAPAPAYFSRRRRVLHRAMSYAVRKKHLEVNPLDRLPDGWTAPAAPADAIDPRAIGSPELVEHMLEACATIGTTDAAPGGRRADCGRLRAARRRVGLTISDAAITAGRAYTDDGLAHEHRGLKGRTRGRPNTRARKPTRRVPIPPELVIMLREHIARFGTGPDGRIFRSKQGNPIQASSWSQVWAKVRAASLDDEQHRSPLMARPYDLWHAGVTRRLNERMPQASVAAWAGHPVEVLTRIYTHVITGQDDALIAQMDAYRRRP
jgi:integrase